MDRAKKKAKAKAKAAKTKAKQVAPAVATPAVEAAPAPVPETNDPHAVAPMTTDNVAAIVPGAVVQEVPIEEK